MVEAIDLDTDFRWIANTPDEFTLSILERRGLTCRLILTPPFDCPEAIANIQVQLESLYDCDPYAELER